MTQVDRLLKALARAVEAGGGIHTPAELAFMVGVQNTPAFTKFLADLVKSGRLRRVCRGVYESTLTPADPAGAIYLVINKKRPNVLNYISLESQLSATGDISQQLLDRVTVMTKGRSGAFVTPYGTVELTHTKRPVAKIMPNLVFDATIHMYRANRQQARADLAACGRNLHMLET